MATHAHPVGARRVRFDPWHVAVVVLAAVPDLGYGRTKSVFIDQLRDGKIAQLWIFVPGVTPPLDKVLPPA
jgi:8-oxo-dGTP pyrophosphatase MutT (NUDIX family)